MSYNSGLDDLGDAIEAIIDHAVRSQDFQHLNQTIRQAVNTAVDTGSDAVRRAVGGATKKSAARRKVVDARDDDPLYVPGYKSWGSAPEQPNVNIYSSTLGSTRASRAQRNAQLPALYQNPTGKLAGGIVKTVGGGIMTLFGAGGVISSGVVALVTSLGGTLSVLGGFSLALLGGGVWLLTSGIRSIKRVGRFEQYLRVLGSKTQCELNRLAQKVGRSPKFVRKELKGMIDDGMFLEGHLDEEENNLITSDDSYVHYLEARQKQAETGGTINFRMISCVAIMGIWALALLLFIIFWLRGSLIWLIFLGAVPVSLITLLVLHSLWGGGKYNLLIISALVLSILALVYFSVFSRNWWQIFLLAIPAECIIVFCFRIKKPHKQ